MPEPSRKVIGNELWEKNGRPEGRENWKLAEHELRNEDKSSPLRTDPL